MAIPAFVFSPFVWKVTSVVLKKSWLVFKVMRTNNPGALARFAFGASYKTSVLINAGIASTYGVAYGTTYVVDKISEKRANKAKLDREKYVYEPTTVSFSYGKRKQPVL